MINRLPEEEEWDPVVARAYEWQYNHYEIRPQAREHFLQYIERWTESAAGKHWWRAAREANAASYLLAKWCRGKARPHRIQLWRVLTLYGWEPADLLPSVAGLSWREAFDRLCPRHGPLNAPLAAQYVDQVTASLARLYVDSETPAREHVRRLKSCYDWLIRILARPSANITPDMLVIFAREIGRKPATLLHGGGGGHPPRAPRAPSVAVERYSEPEMCATIQDMLDTIPAIEPAAPQAPSAYSFFAGCA